MCKKKEENAQEDTDETFVKSQTRFCSPFIIGVCRFGLVYASLTLKIHDTESILLSLCVCVLSFSLACSQLYIFLVVLKTERQEKSSYFYIFVKTIKTISIKIDILIYKNIFDKKYTLNIYNLISLIFVKTYSQKYFKRSSHS